MPTENQTPPPTTEPHYRLPESALVELNRIRSELDTLAEIILRACACDQSMLMTSLAFSQHFQQMSQGIAQALDACGASTNHIDLLSHSRH